MTAVALTPGALRADAARNRELVLEAAQRLFAERGLDVSMHEIASAAGVGVGTIFRRFPTKDALVAAIVERGIAELLALAEDAVERSATEPWEAFADYFIASTELHVRHRGFMEAIGSGRLVDPLHEDVRARLVTALRTLVSTAQRAEALRDDVVAEDLPGMQCAISRTSCMPMGQAVPDGWRRTCALFLDGMRAGAARTPLAPDLPSYEQVVDAIAE